MSPVQNAADGFPTHAQHKHGIGRLLQRVQRRKPVGHGKGGAIVQPQGMKPLARLFQRGGADVGYQCAPGSGQKHHRAQASMVRADIGEYLRALRQRHGGGKPPVQQGRAAMSPVSQGNP